jgi:hypothetical protein
MVDLSSSSDEEDLIPDTSHDFEFTQCLYDELNHALLGPPGDDKIIILSDFDEGKEEVHEEKSTSLFYCSQPRLNRLRQRCRCSCKDKE